MAPSKEDFQKALQTEEPFVLAKMFKLPSIARQKRGNEPSTSSSIRMEVNDLDWSPVMNHWFNAYKAAEAGYAVKCYESQAALHTSFNQVFASSTGNWLVPALHTICRDTHRIAVRADEESNGQDHTKLENAASLLQESFSRTFNDRKELKPHAPFDSEGSKKAGVLAIVNELFAIYFRLNTLRLCKNLVKPVEGRGLHQHGSMGQQVTYCYYVGRLNLFEDQYDAAEANLARALKYCHKDAVANKKRILRYLVPVKLYRGRLPSAELMEKYELFEFVPLVDAVRKGDMRKFNDTLIKFQHGFIRRGTYLLLEKCKTVCYRNLFKRIHMVLEKPQIALTQVADAFEWLGMPLDLDEIECILANLIYRGYIRGYIAHTKRMLVLSKRDPFPVSSVIA